MEEEIQERLEEYYKNIEIEVKYKDIKTYEIKLVKRYNKLNEIIKNKDIIKKSVTFEYKWTDIWTFNSNIEQLKVIINKYFKLYLEKEF